MRLYVMRHCEADSGERMDPTRALTPTGQRQAALMAQFLKRQIGRVDFVLSSMFQRSMQTAQVMAPALGCESIIDTATLDPDGTPEQAWKEIQFVVGDADEVLVITHHPLTDALIEYLCGAKTTKSDETHIHHGAICHIHDGLLCWLVRPDLIARDEDETQIIEASIQLASLLEAWHHTTNRAVRKARRKAAKAAKRIKHGKLEMDFADKGKESRRENEGLTGTSGAMSGYGAPLSEAKGEYYYELEPYKRWVLGSGGASGNCDLCEENAAESWIPAEATWPNADDVPQHPNCDCTVEYKDKRVRYSYFDDDEDEEE